MDEATVLLIIRPIAESLDKLSYSYCTQIGTIKMQIVFCFEKEIKESGLMMS
jgi:hypothetical protein